MSTGYWSCLVEDTHSFTSWAIEFAESVRNGIVYPRWTAQSFWGYGSPTFVLYPPFAFYLTSFISVFTGSVIVAMNFAKFIALFFAGVGMFFLVKEFYPGKTALLSASLYLLLPYNIFGLYFSWTFATAIAHIWFSPIMLFTYRFMKEGRIINILYAGICFSGLILTHLISAYMFTFVVAGFVLFMTIAKRDLKGLITFPLMIIVGSLLSSAYILPLLYEKHFLNLGTFIDTSDFYYANFFIFPDLTGLQPSNFFWPVYYNQFAFNIILICILTALFLNQFVRLKRIKNNENADVVSRYFVLTALITIFLLFGASTFLWELIPFFKYIQFPFRWLSITAFSVAFLSAVKFQRMEQSFSTKKEWISNAVSSFIILLICILPSFKYITLAPVFTEQELIPSKTVYWTLEHLPADIDLEKLEKDGSLENRVGIVKGEGKVEIADWKAESRMIKIKAIQPLTARIRTFYFPGWKAYIDGNQTEIKREDGSGAMLVNIPEGDYELKLVFEDTPVRYYGKIISFFSFITILIFFAISKRHSFKS